MKFFSYTLALILLAGCNASPPTKSTDTTKHTARVETDTLRFADAGPSGAPFTEPSILRAQVILDRLGFSPGVIDGKEGQSYAAALEGFQEAKGLDATGTLDAATLQALQPWRDVAATRLVVIPALFANGPFVADLPSDSAEQAKLAALGYRDLMEALAERFHTTPDTLVGLNSPEANVGAGQTIRVPNIPDVEPLAPADDARGWGPMLQRLGVASAQPAAEKIVVDKSDGVLKAYDAQGDLIAQFPATMGSSHDPLPIGKWKIQGVSKNPEFHYNPKLFWDVSDAKDPVTLPPGPNGPVGVVWIDLNKAHYGIHGTGEPQTIGRAESHGCVRLTNWDAARLAQMVKPGTAAVFQP